jgi:hypothetical protein
MRKGPRAPYSYYIIDSVYFIDVTSNSYVV